MCTSFCTRRRAGRPQTQQATSRHQHNLCRPPCRLSHHPTAQPSINFNKPFHFYNSQNRGVSTTTSNCTSVQPNCEFFDIQLRPTLTTSRLHIPSGCKAFKWIILGARCQFGPHDERTRSDTLEHRSMFQNSFVTIQSLGQFASLAASFRQISFELSFIWKFEFFQL